MLTKNVRQTNAEKNVIRRLFNLIFKYAMAIIELFYVQNSFQRNVQISKVETKLILYPTFSLGNRKKRRTLKIGVFLKSFCIIYRRSSYFHAIYMYQYMSLISNLELIFTFYFISVVYVNFVYLIWIHKNLKFCHQ